MATVSLEARSVKRSTPFYRKPEFLEKAIDIITPERTVETFQSLFKYQEEPQFARDVLNYLKKGYWPVGVFPHFVQADAFAFAKTAQRVTALSKTIADRSKHLRGCYALHQGTMDNGSQGRNMQIYTQKLERAMNRNSMVYLSYITAEHMKKYNLDQEEATAVNLDYDRKIKSAETDKMGLLTFPAGNMNGARRNEQGQLNGMVQSDLGWVTQIAKLVTRGAKIVFIPGAIVDSFRISDPDTRDFTSEAVKHFFRNLCAGILPFGAGSFFQVRLASLRMLKPYSINRLGADLMQLTGNSSIDLSDLRTVGYAMNSNKILTDQLIMGIINDKMPDHLRGNYYKGYQSFGLGDHTDKSPLK